MDPEIKENPQSSEEQRESLTKNASIKEVPDSEEEARGHALSKELVTSIDSRKSKVKAGKSKKKVRTSKSSDISRENASRKKLRSSDIEDQAESRQSNIRQSKMDHDRLSATSKIGKRPQSKSVMMQSHSSLVSEVSAESLDQDVVTLTVTETTQKIVHCHVGKDLFVDKTWCMVKKKDLLEDIAVEDANSPFYNLTQKILDYKPDEFLIGYEPFALEPNQFMLCVTEAGRDDVLNKLEEMKSTYLRRIQQSKAVVPKKWESLGSEEFVDQFQIKNTRKLISLEWIGDISKRCKEPKFEDCDPDDMKNGYTCLLPSDKEKFDLIFRKTQETGVQAVASKTEAEVQTEPEIPTNASTQYAPETEIAVPDTSVTQAAIKSENLDEFFKKYMDYLLDCLQYNEVYDLYHDDYPALYVAGEETQVQQLGTYHQYQSFTDVAAIEGKLVVSSSWHPNYTGIVAIAYANEIPCLMKELEFDSDQTDYEDEKTDNEDEGREEPELGAGARDWLDEERKERESTGENTEIFDKAVRRLKDIEAAKVVWDSKIQEVTEEFRKSIEETEDSASLLAALLQYREYQEPEPEPEPEAEDSATSRVSEAQGEGEDVKEEEGEEGEEGEWPGEGLVPRSTEDGATPKSSKLSYRQQLEEDIEEGEEKLGSAAVIDELFAHESASVASRITGPTTLDTTRDSYQPSLSLNISRSTVGSVPSARKIAHHSKKHKKHTTQSKAQSRVAGEMESYTSLSSKGSSSLESRLYETSRGEKEPYLESEFFDEVTDEEEIKEKQDELPLLEVNNPVLIWSFVDDLTPKLRLDSPYEVSVVQFSRHNGNLVAGGTASGQVVLWDITGRIEELEKPESLTQNQQMFRKRMEDLMSWRRDIRSKRRVRFTAISNQKESHLEKITGMTWVTPTTVVSEQLEILKNPSQDYTLQIITSSVFGNFHVWDLKTEPGKGDYRRAPQIFKTKERFGRPASLDLGLSPYQKLHRIWKPISKVALMYKNMPVLLTGFNLAAAAGSAKYIRITPKVAGVKEVLEDRILYKAVFPEVDDIPLAMYVCNLFGQAGTVVWEPLEAKTSENKESNNIVNIHHYWDSYHDRPITHMSRHPFIHTLTLTVGGHVFAVWHIDNKEEPILSKRYYGVYITDGSWSSLRPSLIRIARSDGVVEIWDLIIQNHAPATTIIVSGRVITNVSPPILPEVRGLLGVADYNSAFCLFFIPQQFRVWTEHELARFTQFINREPERRKTMKEWSKWWRENNVNLDREERKQAEEKKKLDEEVRLEKEKQEEARKKYNEEAYKWYMRRRGKSFLGEEEADDKWREKQEEYMHEMVMAKKKIDRSEMEVLMRPIIREEKNEALKHAKAQERLKQADSIFRQTVELIFPKAAKQVEAPSQEGEELSEQVNSQVAYYFLDNFEKLSDEQEEFVKRSPWQFEFEWSELLEKYNALRMLFNDRRRKRSKTLRWLRKKLREELLKEGRKVHVRTSHMARYPKRKIQRRQENFEWLQHTYGDDYNIYWDKYQPCRRFADRKFSFSPLDEVESTFLGELSEPDVEDEEVPQIFEEGKVMSSLEMITEIGIEHIPEETFAADLDTALLTLESRSSLGVKTIPSLFDKTSSKRSPEALFRTTEEQTVPSVRIFSDKGEEGVPRDHLTVPVSQSPQDDSDVSLELEEQDETPLLLDNQLEELDYIKQPVGTKINTLETKKALAAQKREISHGVKIKFEESVSDDFVMEGVSSLDVEVGSDEVRSSLNLREGSRAESQEGGEGEEGGKDQEEAEITDKDEEITLDTEDGGSVDGE